MTASECAAAETRAAVRYRSAGSWSGPIPCAATALSKTAGKGRRLQKKKGARGAYGSAPEVESMPRLTPSMPVARERCQRAEGPEMGLAEPVADFRAAAYTFNALWSKTMKMTRCTALLGLLRCATTSLTAIAAAGATG